MCFKIGKLRAKVHVSINHVPLPPEINRRKQLTPHPLLNTFHQKTMSQIFDKCICFSFISKLSWGRQLVTTPCGKKALALKRKGVLKFADRVL